MSDELTGFLGNLRTSLVSAAQTQPDSPQKSKAAEDSKYIITPAPNAIEWTVLPEFANIDSAYYHVRQYQVIRDFFQLRCPLPSCNDQSPEARDCWGKGREYLQSENLLVWSAQHGEDVCPCCGSTRSELMNDKLISNYNQMHLVVGMRCLPINTRVHFEDGFHKLSDLLPDNPTPNTFYPINKSVLTENGYEPASDVYYAGKAKTKVVSLKQGLKITGSYIHPVWGYSNGNWGWHKLSDLSPGDYVEARTSTWQSKHDISIDKSIISAAESKFAKNVSKGTVPTVWSEDVGALLGYLTAEGQCNRKYQVRFTNGDQETINHFRSIVKSCFNTDIYQSSKSSTLTYDVNGIMQREFLHGMGINFSRSFEKSVPTSIWTAPVECVHSFLRAYFEGDGTASVETKSKKPVVAAYSTSEKLARGIQSILWSIGISASLTNTKARINKSRNIHGRFKSWSVRIYGNNIRKYSELIGFYSIRKQNALKRCLSALSDGCVEWPIYCVSDRLKQLASSRELPSRILRDTYQCRSGYSSSIQKSVIRDMLALDISDHVLERLVDKNSRLLKVTSVEDGPEMELADLHVPGSHSFVANNVLNHNSGKTATAGIIATYIEHRIINVGHGTHGGLSSYFNQLGGQPFEIAMIASTDVQAADTIWARYVGLRRESPWIQKYIKYIKKLEAAQTTQNGAKPWTYEERDKYITNGVLNLKIKSLNSSSAGLAGRTRIASFVDELARFDSSDSKRSADEAYRVLENSLRTVRSASTKIPATPWFGTMISISSPISEDDKSMRLLKDAPRIKGMYYGHWATWEFNPDQPRILFDDDFEKDPIGAARDFGSQPPTAASPLVTDITRFREMAIQKDLRPTAVFSKFIHKDNTGREYISAKVDTAQLSRDGERYIAYDAGASFDQFAAACAHGEWVDTPEGKQLVTVYDWVYRLLPDHRPRRDIWFDFVVSTVDYLSKFYFISRIEFDRWQSTYLIQQLRNRGIQCEMKGTTAEQFLKLISDINYSKVRMLPPAVDDHKLDPPNMSAQGLAFYEIEHLERSPDLKKIYNPKKGNTRGWNSDDVATVVAHVHSMVQSSVINIGDSNSASNRLKREMVSGHHMDGLGTLFRPSNNQRGW